MPHKQAWSDAIAEADWIKNRLAPFSSHIVTSVVPGRFEAYARLLHPAELPTGGDGRIVRWREVASWSGLALTPDAQFHSIALPQDPPSATPSWRGQGPREGIFEGDARVLVEILRGHTTTPECWFCLWDGYGWPEPLTLIHQPSARVPDPIPASVLSGPRVRFPARDYLLYTGPIEGALGPPGIESLDQTPNLWWPSDRAWCVASDIDLAWSYVGGSAELIKLVLAESRIEALPASPSDPASRVEHRVARWVDDAVTELFRTGKATISTSRGRVEAWMKRPGRFRRGRLWTKRVVDHRTSGLGERMLEQRDESILYKHITVHLTEAVIELAATGASNRPGDPGD